MPALPPTPAMLVLFHCESNTGYAIGRLEPIFYQMALRICNGNPDRVHFAYSSLAKGPPHLPGLSNVTAINSSDESETACKAASDYIRRHGITVIFGFDQPVSRKMYRYWRAAGIQHFISYWGAPMCSLSTPWKLLAKRIEVAIKGRYGPDFYIFESQGMADTAVRGRGIPSRKVSTVYLGVDHEMFRPDTSHEKYIHEQLSIPAQRRVFFYSGHMEERKGVRVIIEAAKHLAESRASDDWHIALFGNKNNEAEPYQELLKGHRAGTHVTFGGYRTDMEKLHRGCYAGVIASTGWDSLTCSSLEMQSSGLPLLYSDLPGLNEAAAPEVSGLPVPTGDSRALAGAMARLLDDQDLRDRLSRNARQRIVDQFTRAHQVDNLVATVRRVMASN